MSEKILDYFGNKLMKEVRDETISSLDMMIEEDENIRLIVSNIENKNLGQKFEEYKREKGGAVRMTVDQIRQKYYEQKGIEKGKEEGLKEGEYKKAVEVAKNLLDVLDDETIALKTGLDIEEVTKLREKQEQI